MISVRVREKEIKVTGHAYGGPPGSDLICCAVSILLQNMIASIKALTEDKIEYDLQPGSSWVRYTEGLTDVSKTLVDSFFIGICMIASDYPENVRID